MMSMKQCIALLLVLAVTLTSVADAKQHSLRVKLEPDQPSDITAHTPWRRHPTSPKPSPAHPLHLTFAMTHRNTQNGELDRVLRAVSDPDSASYGRHYTHAQLAALLRPSRMAIDAVVAFASQYVASPDTDIVVADTGAFVEVHNVSVAAAERMLLTEFHVYVHGGDGANGANGAGLARRSYVRATDHYTLPHHIASVVDFVGGVHRLPRTPLRVDAGLTAAGTAATERKPPAYKVTPAFLRKLYDMPTPSAVSPGSQSTQTVIEFLNQYYNEEDLQSFLKENSLPAQHVSKIVGPNDPSHPGLEATLDVEVIMGMAVGANTEFWSFAGLRNNSAPTSNTNQEPFLRYLLHLDAAVDPPWVHSASYDDDEDSLTKAYTERCNVEFKKAGVRGLSLFFCSGDDGVGGPTVRKGGAAVCPRTRAAFPASSPYITSVGGTQLDDTTMVEVVSDVATGSIITAGGGFSYYFTPPWYQMQEAAYAASQTMSGALPPADKFNNKGRVYPDISGMATNYIIRQGGVDRVIGGTSASTPLIASMVTLLNDASLRHKNHTLGFVNPALYKAYREHGKAAFRDITTGNNRCSAVPGKCCEFGYHATPGFDAVSGTGVPVFSKLMELVAGGRSD